MSQIRLRIDVSHGIGDWQRNLNKTLKKSEDTKGVIRIRILKNRIVVCPFVLFLLAIAAKRKSTKGQTRTVQIVVVE